jgi:hypothetical protein
MISYQDFNPGKYPEAIKAHVGLLLDKHGWLYYYNSCYCRISVLMVMIMGQSHLF